MCSDPVSLILSFVYNMLARSCCASGLYAFTAVQLPCAGSNVGVNIEDKSSANPKASCPCRFDKFEEFCPAVASVILYYFCKNDSTPSVPSVGVGRSKERHVGFRVHPCHWGLLAQARQLRLQRCLRRRRGPWLLHALQRALYSLPISGII